MIKNRIESWLKHLGYSFNRSLYSQVSKMSYSRPSYKTMADTVLMSIKDHNNKVDSNESWQYTTKFVNGMKSNLIINNGYFQSVFKNGLFNPSTNKQNNNISFFDIEVNENNNYNFLKNIYISNGKNRRKFDFVLVINGFPLVLIELVNNKFSSFEKTFFRLEEAIDKFPMFFNFNKLIILTDGITYKLGTLYNFPEEYITFKNYRDCSIQKAKYNIENLEKLLSSKNILKFMKENKNCKQILNYVDVNFNNKLENNLGKSNKILQEKEDQSLDIINNIDQKEIEKTTADIDHNEELVLLAKFFNPDLDEVLNSEDFQKRLEETTEVPDHKQNKLYVEDFQKNRNMDTLEIFIKANERLVIKEVNKFIGYQTTSMDIDDMYQLGCIGLLKALEKFDLTMDNEFSTYAIYWINQSIIRGINNSSLLIRIPTYQWDLLLKLSKLEYRSEVKFDKVDYDWISRELDISKEKTIELLMVKNTYMNNISLDTPVGVNEDTSLGELIPEEEYSVEDIILNMDLANKLKDAIEILDDRSKGILIRRFGLNGKEPMTLEEIGKVYNVTRERIRQIESKALNKLRSPSIIKKYKEYCEG